MDDTLSSSRLCRSMSAAAPRLPMPAPLQDPAGNVLVSRVAVQVCLLPKPHAGQPRPYTPFPHDDHSSDQPHHLNKDGAAAALEPLQGLAQQRTQWCQCVETMGSVASRRGMYVSAALSLRTSESSRLLQRPAVLNTASGTCFPVPVRLGALFGPAIAAPRPLSRCRIGGGPPL